MSSPDAAALLATVDLFDGLSSRALKELASSTKEIEFSAGEQVVSAGDSVAGFKAFSNAGVKMYVVATGSASVHVNGAAVSTMAPGDYFGELSLIDGAPRSADVVAGADGLTALTLSNWDFDELIKKHPEIAVPMLKVVVARLRRAESADSPSE